MRRVKLWGRKVCLSFLFFVHVLLFKKHVQITVNAAPWKSCKIFLEMRIMLLLASEESYMAIMHDSNNITKELKCARMPN